LITLLSLVVAVEAVISEVAVVVAVYAQLSLQQGVGVH
jgi:hypothetical protein